MGEIRPINRGNGSGPRGKKYDPRGMNSGGSHIPDDRERNTRKFIQRAGQRLPPRTKSRVTRDLEFKKDLIEKRQKKYDEDMASVEHKDHRRA